MAGLNDTMSSMRPVGIGQLAYEGLRGEKKKRPMAPTTIAGGSFGVSRSDAPVAPLPGTSVPSVDGVHRFK